MLCSMILQLGMPLSLPFLQMLPLPCPFHALTTHHQGIHAFLRDRVGAGQGQKAGRERE